MLDVREDADRRPSTSWTPEKRAVEKGVPTKDTFPPHHDALDPGVAGVQNGRHLNQRSSGGHGHETGLDEDGAAEEDEPDI